MTADGLRSLVEKATPGPWEVFVHTETPEWIDVLDVEGRQVFTTMGGTLDVEKTNATLGSLAPDLALLVADMAEALQWVADNHPRVMREMPGELFHPLLLAALGEQAT